MKGFATNEDHHITILRILYAMPAMHPTSPGRMVAAVVAVMAAVAAAVAAVGHDRLGSMRCGGF